METNQVIKALSNYKNGTYIKVQFISKIPTTKEYKDCSLVKVISTVTRLGCSYKNVVKDWVPSENHKKWYHNLYKNILVQHNNDENKVYIKMYATNNPYNTEVKYFLNGKETICPMIVDMIKIKEKDGENEPKMYLKNIEDIIKIGK